MKYSWNSKRNMLQFERTYFEDTSPCFDEEGTPIATSTEKEVKDVQHKNVHYLDVHQMMVEADRQPQFERRKSEDSFGPFYLMGETEDARVMIPRYASRPPVEPTFTQDGNPIAKPCPVCGEMCANGRSFKLHLLLDHLPPMRNKCPMCKWHMSTPYQLNRHLWNRHMRKPRQARRVCRMFRTGECAPIW